MLHTRIAPSPTGLLHIGNARTAYFNWLAARSTGGNFTLRIDDTDKVRSKQEYVDNILETFHWLGLDYNYLIYQSSRAKRHQELAQEWIWRGLATANEGKVRFNLKNSDLPKEWNDQCLGKIAITDDDFAKMEGTVLLREDGSPTYNWASVIDDMDCKINYILRGVDHITNTSKQVVFWHLLVHPIPKFAHVGLIGEKGKPLSKSEGAASMLYYREKGYDPDAMLNFLARLGWGPKVDDKTTKNLPKEKMLELFLNGGNLRSSLANMDLQKLEAFDRQYKAKKGIWRNKTQL